MVSVDHSRDLRALGYDSPVTKTRLEAFSDGVIAVIITIIVLELKVPHGADLDALRPLLPAFLEAKLMDGTSLEA